MSADRVRLALQRTEAVLLPGDTLAGALARAAAGSPEERDSAIFRARAAQIEAARQPDGSWQGPDGALASTARALLELAELRDRAGVESAPELIAPALEWLRARRGRPGRFGEGCTGGFHRAGLCHHFVTSFHAPAEARAGGPEVLVADSAQALRAALLWGAEDAAATALELQLDGLRQVIRAWAWPEGPPVLGPRAGVAALACLLDAPRRAANVRAAADGVACLVRTQRADGTWPDVDLVAVLETLLLGVQRGYHVPEVDAALARAARLLSLSQKPDGTWGREQGGDPGRLPYVAWRVLRHALGYADANLELTSARGCGP